MHQVLNIHKGKFHAPMINTTPNGSDTISADEGKVVIEVLTCNEWKDFALNNAQLSRQHDAS